MADEPREDAQPDLTGEQALGVTGVDSAGQAEPGPETVSAEPALDAGPMQTERLERGALDEAAFGVPVDLLAADTPAGRSEPITLYSDGPGAGEAEEGGPGADGMAPLAESGVSGPDLDETDPDKKDLGETDPGETDPGEADSGGTASWDEAGVGVTDLGGTALWDEPGIGEVGPDEIDLDEADPGGTASWDEPGGGGTRLGETDLRETDTGELAVVGVPGRSRLNDTRPLPVSRSGRPIRPGRVAGRGRRRARWIVPSVIVLLLAAAYVGASYYLANRVPRGASVAGVEIGGLTDAAAVDRLRAELDPKSKQTVDVVIGPQEAVFDPVIAGLSFSPEETVASVAGLSFNPARIWDHIGGIGPVPPAVGVNHQTLEAYVADLAAQTVVEPVDGTLTVASGEVVTTEPAVGMSLDSAAALKQIQADYLAKAGPWQLPASLTEPRIGQEQLDQAVAAIADPLLSGPVDVVIAEATVEIPVTAVAQAALIGPADDAAEGLALDWDSQLLAQAVSQRLPAGVETNAEDARFVFVDGQPVIEDGRQGLKIDADQLAEAMTTAALATGDDRVAAIELIAVDPESERAELEQLGVEEVISRFETQATNSPDRTKNLRKAAEMVTGMLVKPGQTFSLDQALGHRSLETGWFDAGVVVSGVSQSGIGGGLSQFSTTLYNAAHLAGMVDVEHQPHANYFSRYPAGREATLWEGEIDNKFKNDTPYGVVLSAGVTDSLTVWVELWSTKYWTVEAEIGQPYGYVAPRTIQSTRADCQPQTAGSSGFEVDYWRVKTDPDGNAQEQETWHWRYDPMNTIICKRPGNADD
ncbi:MAG: VanW family protein [Bifidobacteriaceae bacterium]|jgi:vancomycin resistance protein YoaR|nr:VanW family protein [Bifidobacteriaceae bacterium]